MSKTDLALDAASIVASVSHPVLAAVLSGGKLSLGIIRQLFPNADDDMAAFINEEIMQGVFTRLPLLERNFEEIKAKLGDEPSATQVAIVYKAFVHAFGKADGKKRAMLLDALVNAFDPELYEQSMTARLLALLDDLDYPDLQYLMKIGKTPDAQVSPWTDYKSMDGYHATRLVEAGLVARQPLSPNQREKDIAHVAGPGRLMIKLIQNPETVDK